MLIAGICKSVNGLAHLSGVDGDEAAQYGSGQDGEPHLHLVQPGGMGRCVGKMHRWMAGQPPVMLGLMSAKVVEDHMQLRFGMLGYYPVHEVPELPTTPAAEAPPHAPFHYAPPERQRA